MACSAVRSPILRNPSIRNYAALAKAAHAASSCPVEPQVLSNKVTVAALDNNSPVAQVSIVFKAGSRNETYETQGLAHLLRITAGLTTSRSSTFAITRNIQQLGGNLYAVSDRESIAYTLQVTRDKLEKALTFLEDVATRTEFRPWEISDSIPRLRYELSTISENARIVELLHKAAYRDGLGYSLYSPKRQLDKISSESLQHFVNNFFTGSRCAVVATGIPVTEICALAQNLNLGTGNGTNNPSKFHGGEIRKERNSPLTSVAVAVESAGFDKEKDTLAFAVLQHAAGTGPHVKWGNAITPLHRAVASTAGSDPFAITSFNVNYSDNGLFGFLLQAPANAAGPLTKAAYKWMSSPNISDADITRGKTELKAAILYATDTNSAQHDNIVQQTLFKGRVVTPAGLAAEVDKITPADVKSVAGKLSGKVAMASIGNLSTVPHVDHLC